VKAYDAILQVSDGIMVARGDLGVELPVTSVPPIQKRLVRGARAAAKPVIVATQMLESMIESPVPTRAEVSDVATAIYEGADAVMLSAESAAGKYPVEAVTTMNNVAIASRRTRPTGQVIEASRVVRRESVADGIVAAAREIAEATNIKAICCFSQSGTTASLVARERPHVPIIALTPLMSTARRLALTWGAHCVITAAAGTLQGRGAGGGQVPRGPDGFDRGRPDRRHRRRAVQRQGHHQHPARGPL
jgi:pyruvate kinase